MAKARFLTPEMREKNRLATIKYNVEHSGYGDIKYYDGQ
jgi:hypothetical protein